MTAFSIPVLVGDVPAGGRSFRIEADAEARTALAARVGVPAIAALEANLLVRPFGRGGLAVTGEVAARLTQTCVVTFEDFESTVTAPVDIRFSPDGIDPNAEIDLSTLMDIEGEDPPDLLVDGRIDLGAIVAEFLVLALDPYPRKPGAAFEAAEPEGEASPFAALKALRKGD